MHSQRGSGERHEARGFQRLRVTFQADKRRGANKTANSAVDELKQPKSISKETGKRTNKNLKYYLIEGWRTFHDDYHDHISEKSLQKDLGNDQRQGP
jgi:hypothetical protein